MAWRDLFRICERCGGPVGKKQTGCRRCFPSAKTLTGCGVVKPSRFLPRALCMTCVTPHPTGEMCADCTHRSADFMPIAPSPTIDVLDLDLSALRALEEIANG